MFPSARSREEKDFPFVEYEKICGARKEETKRRARGLFLLFVRFSSQHSGATGGRRDPRVVRRKEAKVKESERDRTLEENDEVGGKTRRKGERPNVVLCRKYANPLAKSQLKKRGRKSLGSSLEATETFGDNTQPLFLTKNRQQIQFIVYFFRFFVAK